MQQSSQLVGCGRIRHAQVAGVFVDEISPHALQETLHTHDVAGVPGTTRFEWSHAHLVQAERVGAVFVVHLVGRDDVLEALAHLPVFARDLLALEPIGAIALFHLGRRNRLAARIAVCVGLDVALIEETVERLGTRDVPEIEQNLVPEARVQQVQHCVFDATHVQIDATGVSGATVAIVGRTHPVLLDRRIDEVVGVGGVEISQFVPARSGPLRHHVDLAAVFLRAVAEIERDGGPLGRARERRNRVGHVVVGIEGLGFEVLELGQQHRQHRRRQRHRAAVGVVHDREWLAPVALTAEQPVAQLVVDGGLAASVAFEPLVHDALALVDRFDAVQIEIGAGRVDVHAVAHEGLGPRRRVDRRPRLRCERTSLEPRGRRLLNRRNGQAELAGELEVAFVAARNRHDRTGSVSHQYVVGDPDRNRLAVQRIDRERAGEHAGLLAAFGLTIEVLGGGSGGSVGVDGRTLFSGRERVHERMFGREHHERRTEQRVGASGEHRDGAGRRFEVDACTVTAADPVALHQLDGLGPVEAIEIVEQTVGVRGDSHHPLAHVLLEHRVIADVAAAVGRDLFVGEDRAETRTPVDRRFRQIRQTMRIDESALLGPRQRTPGATIAGGPLTRRQFGFEFGDRSCTTPFGVVPRVEHLQEDPLRPAVEVFVSGAHAAPRVVSQSEATQLTTHVGHVRFGVHPRMDTRGDGVLFGWQTETVVTERVKNVEAHHALEASVHVGADVAERVSDVQTGTTRVREHVEHEELRSTGHLVGFGQRAGRIRCVERALGVPAVLPGLLDATGQRRVVAVARGVVGRCGHGCPG